MPEHTSAGMATDLIATMSRVFDRYPGFAETVHDVVVEHLNRGPHGTFPDGFDHVAQHVREIFPAVMQDSRIEAMQGRLLDEYARMPATPETRLRQAPGDQSVGGLVLVGGGVLLLVVVVTVAYCLSGSDPAPGESAPAHC